MENTTSSSFSTEEDKYLYESDDESVVSMIREHQRESTIAQLKADHPLHIPWLSVVLQWVTDSDTAQARRSAEKTAERAHWVAHFDASTWNTVRWNYIEHGEVLADFSWVVPNEGHTFPHVPPDSRWHGPRYAWNKLLALLFVDALRPQQWNFCQDLDALRAQIATYCTTVAGPRVAQHFVPTWYEEIMMHFVCITASYPAVLCSTLPTGIRIVEDAPAPNDDGTGYSVQHAYTTADTQQQQQKSSWSVDDFHRLRIQVEDLLEGVVAALHVRKNTSATEAIIVNDDDENNNADDNENDEEDVDDDDENNNADDTENDEEDVDDDEDVNGADEPKGGPPTDEPEAMHVVEATAAATVTHAIVHATTTALSDEERDACLDCVLNTPVLLYLEGMLPTLSMQDTNASQRSIALLLELLALATSAQKLPRARERCTAAIVFWQSAYDYVDTGDYTARIDRAVAHLEKLMLSCNGCTVTPVLNNAENNGENSPLPPSSHDTDVGGGSDHGAPANIMDEYREKLRPEQLCTTPPLKDHAFSQRTLLRTSGLRRLRREWHDFATSLVLDGPHGNIFVRWSILDRPAQLRAVITPALATPYAGGWFVFDIVVSHDYPRTPPQMLFKTTNGNTVRFNPNLYSNGKVCLSLLGTWAGEPWNPRVSNLNQVLLSIFAMIFTEHPFYNEPGYHRLRGTEEGNARSAQYTADARYHTLRHAVHDVLCPPIQTSHDVGAGECKNCAPNAASEDSIADSPTPQDDNTDDEDDELRKTALQHFKTLWPLLQPTYKQWAEEEEDAVRRDTMHQCIRACTRATEGTTNTTIHATD